MKLLLLLTLSIFAFASTQSTDVLDAKTNADEILFLSTNNFECNLYIEKAGHSLLLMSLAEDSHNLTAVANNYVLFMDQSNRAVAICKEVSPVVANDIIEVQSNIKMYYKSTYKQVHMEPILISINKQQVQLGYILPDKITEFALQTNPFIRLDVEPAQATFIKAWLNDVVDRLDTEYVLYNGTLVKSTELRKF